MALYLGDTEVAPVIEVPVPEKRYNVGISNLLGNVDENGAYRPPTEPFTPDFSSIKSISGFGTFRGVFFYNERITGDILFGTEEIGGDFVMQSAFESCSSLTSVSFPALTTISGFYAMSNAFQSCSSLTSVSFPALTTISGTSTMSNAFQSCSSLTSVSFPSLTTISGTSVFNRTFLGCSGLTSVSFPALKEILPETTQNQFDSRSFSGCTALTEIHFPAAMQARVEQLSGYSSKFGASNATIYFDL